MIDPETLLNQCSCIVAANAEEFASANASNLSRALDQACERGVGALDLVRNDHAFLFAQRRRKGWLVYLGRGLRREKRFEFMARPVEGPTVVRTNGLRGLFEWGFPVVSPDTLRAIAADFVARRERSGAHHWARLET